MAKRRNTISAEVRVDDYVSGEVDVSDLSDEDLMACVAEAKSRGLLGGVAVGSRRERLHDVYQDLVANRRRGILEAFERAIFPLEEDHHLLECWRALQRGEYAAAICFLDGEVYSDSLDRHKTSAQQLKLGGA